MDVTVLVVSHGDRRWHDLALERALPSARTQAKVRVFHTPDNVTTGEARNRAVDQFDPQGWIIFLDADDELEPGYVENLTRGAGPWADLHVPSIRFVAPGKPRMNPRTLSERNILSLNPCPIGTMIHRTMFDAAERFWDEPAWEDWSLFRRVALLGGTLRFAPKAVYRAHVDTAGRNSTVTNPKKLHASIVASTDQWLEDLEADA